MEHASKRHGPLIVSAIPLSREFNIATSTCTVVPALIRVHFGQVKETGWVESHAVPPDSGVPSIERGYPSPALYE